MTGTGWITKAWAALFAPRQTTWCYCPGCKQDLVSSNSLVSDTDVVLYHCVECGTESRWDFDHYPCPVRIP